MAKIFGKRQAVYDSEDDDFVNPPTRTGGPQMIVDRFQMLGFVDDEEKKRKSSHFSTLNIETTYNEVVAEGVQRENKKPKGNTSTAGEVANIQLFNKLSTRITTNSMYWAVKSMSVEQRYLLIDEGFGGVMDVQMRNLPSHLAYFLVDRFNSESCSIELDNGVIEITKETVKSMLGLPNGLVEISGLPDCDLNDKEFLAWKNQYKGDKFNVGNYLKRIRTTDKADKFFKLNFVTLFMNTFGETDPSGSSKISIVRKLIKVDDWSKLNWCGYMLECLFRSRHKWRPYDKNSYFTGPLEFLMLVYANRVICEDVKLRRLKPFIKELDCEHLRVLEEFEMKKGAFGSLQMREEEMGFYAKTHVQPAIQDLNIQLSHGMKMVELHNKEMKDIMLEGLLRYPGDEDMLRWTWVLESLFSQTEFTGIRSAFEEHYKEESARVYKPKELFVSNNNMEGQSGSKGKCVVGREKMEIDEMHKTKHWGK